MNARAGDMGQARWRRLNRSRHSSLTSNRTTKLNRVVQNRERVAKPPNLPVETNIPEPLNMLVVERLVCETLIVRLIDPQSPQPQCPKLYKPKADRFARKVRLRMTKRLALLWERVVKEGASETPLLSGSS